MSDHVWAAELATEMISEHGRSMLLRTFTQSGDPWSPSLTPVDTPVNRMDALRPRPVFN